MAKFAEIRYCTIPHIDNIRYCKNARPVRALKIRQDTVLYQCYHLAILVRENSLFVTQGAFQFLCASQFFPMNGLAVVVKKNSSMGKNCDLHRNWNVPFVTHREFQNTLLAASPLVEYFPVPKSPNDSIGTVLLTCLLLF